MGMTIKQMNRAQFWDALDGYRAALRKGESIAIVVSSLAIHSALGANHIPKAWESHVNRAFRTNGAE